jgi:tetratricopeptide (TPR) repeat protein
MSHIKTLPFYAVLVFVAACSQPGVKASQPVLTESKAVVTESQAQQPAEAVVKPAVDAATEAKAKAQAALPKQDLTPDILFKLLVAEVAGQRGSIAIAQSTYIDLARQTRDPRIAQRATEVSLFAHDQTGALEAARLWVATDQDSDRAQQTLAALLLNEGKLNEAEPILGKLLKDDPASGFLHLSAWMGKVRDTQAALGLVERLASNYPALPEARFAVAQACANAGRFDEAVAALKQADGLRPGWEYAALMRAQILAKTSRADALAFMRDFLAAHADAREMRSMPTSSTKRAPSFPDSRTITRAMPKSVLLRGCYRCKWAMSAQRMIF